MPLKPLVRPRSMADVPRNVRRKARIATIITLAILLMALWLDILRRPLPLPAEEGVEVIDADEILHSSQFQQRMPPPPTTTSHTQPTEQEPTLQGEEEIPQELVQTPQSESNPNPENKEADAASQPVEKPPTETPPDTTTSATSETSDLEVQPDPNVLFPSLPDTSDKSQMDHSKGNSTQSSNTANGRSQSDGLSFSLAGRELVSYPRIRDVSEKEGTVVVEIVVDPQGNVVSARTGIRGSTTTDPYLLQLAKEAALQTKFTASPNRITDQIGTITIHFRLR